MTPKELAELRRHVNVSQEVMALNLGMTRRGYQCYELGEVPMKKLHILAIERILMRAAIERRDPSLLPKGLKQEIAKIARELL